MKKILLLAAALSAATLTFAGGEACSDKEKCDAKCEKACCADKKKDCADCKGCGTKEACKEACKDGCKCEAPKADKK